jgi:hypothetical protein
MLASAIRSMKNIQLSTRGTDEIVVIALLCAALPASIGYCIQPPDLQFDHLRLFDAALCSLLGIVFWGAYHCFGFDHFVGKKAVTAIFAAVILWVLAVAGLMMALYRVDADYSSQIVTFTTTIL